MGHKLHGSVSLINGSTEFLVDLGYSCGQLVADTIYVRAGWFGVCNSLEFSIESSSLGDLQSCVKRSKAAFRQTHHLLICQKQMAVNPCRYMHQVQVTCFCVLCMPHDVYEYRENNLLFETLNSDSEPRVHHEKKPPQSRNRRLTYRLVKDDK